MRTLAYPACALAMLAACAPPRGDPIAPALEMFDAVVRRDATGVQRRLDSQGVYLAEKKCLKGLAINCFLYPSSGRFQSRTARLTRRSDAISTRTFAYVEVKSVWAPETASQIGPTVLCQEFQVSYLDKQWRVQDFGHLDPCAL